MPNGLLWPRHTMCSPLMRPYGGMWAAWATSNHGWWNFPHRSTTGALEDKMEVTACYCALENPQLDLASKQFLGAKSKLVQPARPDHMMMELLK